jgi:hypothetical protein
MLRLACGFLSLYLRKEEASSETLYVFFVRRMKKFLKEISEVSDIKPLSRIVMMRKMLSWKLCETIKKTI